MARTAQITLDGVEYEIHAFNIKELMEVSEIITKHQGEPMVLGMKILGVAMRRATPKVDLELLEPKWPEVGATTEVIMALAGIEKKVDPQAAAPAGS